MSDQTQPAVAGPPPNVPQVDLLLQLVQQQNSLLQQQASAMQTLQARLGSLELQLNGGRAADDPRPALRNDVLWARLKPYDKHARHLRMRSFIEEVGCVMEGGTGAIGSIPVWYAVRPEDRAALERYHQNDNDDYSPPLLDIATSAEREQIDQAEELWRKTNAGERPKVRSQKQVRARAQDRLAPAAQPARPSAPPAVARGAEAFLPQTQQGQQDQLRQVFRAPEVNLVQPQVLPAPLAGRAAALQNLPAASPAVPPETPAQAALAQLAPMPTAVPAGVPAAVPTATLPPPPAPPPQSAPVASRHAARAAAARVAKGINTPMPTVDPDAESLADEEAVADAADLAELAAGKKGITRGPLVGEEPIPGVRRRSRNGVPTGEGDGDDDNDDND